MVQVLITIDTECSMGGAWEDPRHKPVDPERAVLGKIGHRYYGIPRIMDVLEEHDLTGTFFVEVFAALNGLQPDLSRAYGEIVRRGHEAQLHLHPIQLHYCSVREGKLDPRQLPLTKDMIGAFPPQEQEDMLRKGISLFREMVGKSPVAFRAGNFGASMSTLKVLDKLGFRFDSSFSAAYTQSDCLLDSKGAVNRAWQHGQLWEVPVTSFLTGAWGMHSWKPLNINAVSLWEMTDVLQQAEQIGLSTVTFILHSFSLFKTADLQFRRLKPDWIVSRRFEGLCRFLGRNSDRFRVTGFSDINTSSLLASETSFPKVGAIIPALRKGVQAVNRIYWV